MGNVDKEDNLDAILDFCEKAVEDSVDIDPKFLELVNDNF